MENTPLKFRTQFHRSLCVVSGLLSKTWVVEINGSLLNKVNKITGVLFSQEVSWDLITQVRVASIS